MITVEDIPVLSVNVLVAYLLAQAGRHSCFSEVMNNFLSSIVYDVKELSE